MSGRTERIGTRRRRGVSHFALGALLGAALVSMAEESRLSDSSGTEVWSLIEERRPKQTPSH
jgi:hypothetical protein